MLDALRTVPAVVGLEQQRFSVWRVFLEAIGLSSCIQFGQGNARFRGIEVPVELVPIAVKTRAVNVRLKLPTFRSFDLVAEHRLVLVGAHHVLCRGSVPRQWIRLKVRFTQPSIGFMALLFDETNLELNALGKAPFRSSCPTDFGDAIGFIKSSRLVPG